MARRLSEAEFQKITSLYQKRWWELPRWAWDRCTFCWSTAQCTHPRHWLCRPMWTGLCHTRVSTDDWRSPSLLLPFLLNWHSRSRFHCFCAVPWAKFVEERGARERTNWSKHFWFSSDQNNEWSFLEYSSCWIMVESWILWPPMSTCISCEYIWRYRITDWLRYQLEQSHHKPEAQSLTEVGFWVSTAVTGIFSVFRVQLKSTITCINKH